jgi:phosphatidylinositol alpha-mannosyltransferase
LVLAPARSSTPDEDGVRFVGTPVRVPFNGSVAPISPDPAARWRIRGHLERFRADVLHAHEPFAPSVSLAGVLGATGPVVATFHAFAERGRTLTALAPVLRPLWNRLDVRLAVSEAAASFVGARFDGEVRIVPNGVDVGRFADAKPADLGPGPTLLFVGRLEPRKGFRTAVAAFELLSAELPDLRLVVVGEGAERGAVDGLAPAVRGRTSMLGFVAEAAKPGVVAAADVLVAPATGGESFGVVLVEAMAAGVPVVASDIPGYRDVVRDGTNGLLVPPEDPVAVAAAVRRLLAEPALADRLREGGRTAAARYDWAVVTDQVEAAYRDALQRRRR